MTRLARSDAGTVASERYRWRCPARQRARLGAAQCALAPSAPPQTQPAPEPKGPPTPVCAGCHEQPHASIAMTAHGAKNDATGSMCQACHGDATEHLKDPAKSKPANLIKYGTAAEKTAVCFACHSTNRQLAFWESGKHALNDVACSNCHSIHGKQGNPTIAPFKTTFRPNESEVCGTCHQDIRSQTLKPFASPDRRRQGQVLRLPQSAWRDQPRDAAQRDGQRPVPELPRRQARTVRVLPPAGRGELHDLPQPARLVARQSC